MSPSPAKSTLACISCSDRKVKCDRQNPCNSCVKHKVQCTYRQPKLSQRKRKHVINEMVEERLKHYEAILQKRGIDPYQVTGSSETEHPEKSSIPEEPETVWQMPAPASAASGPQATIFKARLVQGQKGTKLLDNTLWSRVAEEIHDAEDASQNDSDNDASDDEASIEDFAYILDWKKPVARHSHPSTEHILVLWQIFVDNVNPLTKLVHIPSLHSSIEKATADIEHVPKAFEALMFAIYSMAVFSLPNDECKERLGEARSTLLRRYAAATQVALSRAKFMSTTSIVVLQAFVLHIFSIRDSCEPRAVWSLTGAAIRVAEGMGMRLDGTLLGLSPFETEIHRRVWWQLRMHDFRAAELSGQAKFRDFEIGDNTPKKPANVNDSDLFPSMAQAPVESTRPTEMIWCLIRTDLATFAASQKVKMQKSGKSVFSSEEYVAMDDLKIKDDFIKNMEDMIETKYLRFCDPSQPLQLLALVGARYAFNLVRLLAHHPRRWAKLDHVPASEQNLVWGIVIQLLEQFNMMQTNPQLLRFAWSAPYFVQWHAVIHILDTLRANPLHLDAAKAWLIIDSLYENNLEMLLNVKRPIFVAVGNLCLKAFNARVTALTKQNWSPPITKVYITKLREQRETAKARREALIRGKRDQEAIGNEKSLTAMELDYEQGVARAASKVAPVGNQPQQFSATIQQPGLVQGSRRMEDDAFWLSDNWNDGIFASGPADMMNQGTDAMMSQGSWLDAPSDEVIDWGQWDLWMGNVDSLRPNNVTATGRGSG